MYINLKCVMCNQVTIGQPRHIVIYTYVYNASLRCPADHLCSDFITAYVTLSRRSKVPTQLCVTPGTYLQYFFSLKLHISVPLHFFLSNSTLSQKQPPCPTLLTYFSVMFLFYLVGDPLQYINVYTTKHMRPNMFQTTFTGGLSKCVFGVVNICI